MPDRPGHRIPPLRGLLHFAIGFIGGLAQGLVTPPDERRRQQLGRWRGRWHAWVGGLTVPEPGLPPSPREARRLKALRRRLLGRSRAQLVLAMGPPAAAASLAAHVGPAHYWNADTWYYVLDRTRRHVLAVTFSGDRAEALDLVPGP